MAKESEEKNKGNNGRNKGKNNKDDDDKGHKGRNKKGDDDKGYNKNKNKNNKDDDDKGHNKNANNKGKNNNSKGKNDEKGDHKKNNRKDNKPDTNDTKGPTAAQIAARKKAKQDALNKKKGKPIKKAATGNTSIKKPLINKNDAEGYDKGKFKLKEYKFSGSGEAVSMGKKEEIIGQSIKKGIEKFKSNPKIYLAMQYQTDMIDWPEQDQKYLYIHRLGTKGYIPHVTKNNDNPWLTLLMYDYEALPPLKNNSLSAPHKDKYTDDMCYENKKLHSPNNLPLLPGRGMGCVDIPDIKLIGDIDPSDIKQGCVGDCWLLSGISCLAEFDGAIKKLFRKTKNLDQRPFSDEPNIYTITLWDLETWKQVDIEVDERLCVTADSNNTNSRLLGASPSSDGELWVCYLEKAIAAHCGGWDNINGGHCTHAWALMTGCKNQYIIRYNSATDKYGCFGKYNTHEKRWAKYANSPHHCEKSMWSVPWPKVGSGPDSSGICIEITKDELFEKMVEWDEHNYIVGCSNSTNNENEKNPGEDSGLIKNHAYSVIEAHSNVDDTKIDLLKIRNPWGTGEIVNGMFDDDGIGWKKYPNIKEILDPVVANDGIFYVTKDEFFKMYNTIYLSASDMTRFLED